MKKYLVIAVTNMQGFFIYDTYRTFIVLAESPKEAENVVATMPYFVSIDSTNEINEANANALIAINRTRNIAANITEVLIY